ncbi:MAG: Fe-S cluster assembly ATPase SufC [Chlamydiae bacterium RIFCSPHIGHO2_12_FULL_49_11]|nr:MAG: Fe-S cluster assembly ATPase SufC [Chlamydiae bacterium RIFCSPHIGHO2_12_FULL_49_11]
MLTISNLHVKAEGKEILSGVNLEVKPGQVHAIMGPNGAGKSTLAKVLAGYPFYDVEWGTIRFCDKDLMELEPHERSKAGLFVGSQYPLEVPGLSNREFLFEIFKAHTGEKSRDRFEVALAHLVKQQKIDPSFLDRDLNAGFSGGEKKKNEILQMGLIDPKLAVLDETDSGLDIDALKQVASNIRSFLRPDKSIILITHYRRLLDYVKPDFVHVMTDGKITATGGFELVEKLEAHGYAPC